MKDYLGFNALIAFGYLLGSRDIARTAVAFVITSLLGWLIYSVLSAVLGRAP